MAGKIKGITIEIGAETKGFKNGLKDLNKSSKDLQNELSAVNRALKHDPKNTELLRQKQELLTKSVAETKTKLDVLRQAKETADKQMANGTEINQEEYRKLQREISFAETKLDGLKKETKEFGDVSKQQLKIVGDKFAEVGGKIEGAGKKLAGLSAASGAAVAGIAAIGAKAALASDDINTLAKQTGMAVEDIQKYQYSADLLDVSFDTLQGSMAKLTKNMSNAQKGTGDAKTAFEELGIKITDANGNFRDNEEVFMDTMKALEGVSNETQRDAYAMAIFGKSAQDLNPLILGGADALKELGTQWEEMGIILSGDELNKLNEVNDAMDTLKAQRDGTLMLLGAEISEALLPVFEKLTDMLSDALTWIQGLDSKTIATITTVLGITAVLAPLLIVVGQVITAVKTILTLGPMLSTALAGVKIAFAAIGGPVTIIMALIGVLIAKFVHAYNTSEEFRNKVNAAFAKVKEVVSDAVTAVNEKVKEFIDVGKNVMEGLWNGIKDKVEWLKGKVTGVVDTIKGWFTGKDAFDTHSPSKWSEGIGAWVMQGLGNGFKKFQPAVDAAKNAVIRIKGDFDKNIKNALKSTNAQIEAFQKRAIKEQADLELKQYKDNLAKKKEQLLKAETKDKKTILDEIAQIEAEWNKKQIDAARTAEEQKLQERMSALKEMERDYETALSAIEQKQSSTQGKLSGYGSLFNTEQDDDGNVKYKTNSLKEYIATMDEYQSVIEELKSKGIDEGLLAEMNNMSIDDAIGYGQQLFKMEKGAFEEYNALWVEKQQKAKEIAESLYKSELDTLSTDFNGKLDSELSVLKETTFATGSESIQSLIDGMNSQETSAISAAKALGSRIASALKAAKGDEEDADGSHRTGLFRVPFDGYRAILHRNERVLTAAEAARYNGGNTTTNNDSFTVNIAKVENSNGRTTQDLMREMEFYRKSRVAAVGGV